ncbi:Transposon Ty3-I Gag-Pol polyprotein [Senna tora]|uniref:Transposon Ty3-I Gag-Pol polyprotein n=1 Tax=Senna tora TaxID=362788 RepID=A0A835CHQ9_9FABA|nr:Transposon Ty3-I Gag-Pol polyprotein [Senna tora]
MAHEMEKIFEILEVTDYEKVILATFTFTEETEHWWRNTKGVLQVWNAQLTWESFMAEFYEKYFPRSIQDEKETEFINLKQEDGDMSVDTYVAKFIQLSRYSSYLKKCDDEPWKTEKLERGFKPGIRDRVATQEIRVFNKRPREEESGIKNNKKNGRGPWNKKGQGVCYRCGKLGHMGRDCSQLKGASHSFISYDCVKRLELTINVLPYDLSISTPTGMKIVTLDVFLNFIVQFNHCYTTIDLIWMPFHELDVIIGMNWMIANHAVLDCTQKVIFVPNCGTIPCIRSELAFSSTAQA